MHVNGVQNGAWPTLPFGSLRLWDNGTAWSQVEAEQGRYNWFALDTAVSNAEQHGVKNILLVLGSTPTWNASKVNDTDYPVPGAASKPKDMKAWDAWVSQVATRYKGRINGYEIWNEANLKRFWNGSPAQMADLTKRTAKIVKSIDPDAKIVAASVTTRLTSEYDRFFPAYLSALAAADWPIDVFAIHPYPASEGTPVDRVGFIEQVKMDLKTASAPELPIWDTEINYGLAGPGKSHPKIDIAGIDAAGWVVRTYLEGLALGVERSYWYIWTIEPYPLLGIQVTDTSDGGKGIADVQDWVAGAESLKCSVQGEITGCDVTKHGAESKILWATEGQVAAKAPLTGQACDVLGKCREVMQGDNLDLDLNPVRVSTGS